MNSLYLPHLRSESRQLHHLLPRRSSSSGDSITRMVSYGTGVKPTLQKRNSGSWLTRSSNTPKYLWIRLALFERILAGIIEHLVENHM